MIDDFRFRWGAVVEPIPVARHPQVGGMHGDMGTITSAQVSGVAGMVEIPMSLYHPFQVARSAARVLESSIQGRLAIVTAAIDQLKPFSWCSR